MTLQIEQLTIDAHDPDSLADWWCKALEWEVTYRSPEGEEEREVAIRAAGGEGLEILFVSNSEEKVVKNRYHLDLRPDDKDAEVKRMKELGAVEVDIGQKDVTWVVLADPEGNEFCVLSGKAQ